MNSYLVTFLSTHHALKAEKILKKEESGIDLIPTPREISSECGFSIFIENTVRKPEQILKNIDYEHIYMINYSPDGEKNYEKNN